MFSFNIHDHNFSHVHFIGIGGISMSGLAEILLKEGYNVSGSDIKNSAILNKLSNKGALVYIGHDKENIRGADLIVYTDAISIDNPEYMEAINKEIVMVDRGTFLGQIMKSYKESIAVSGTHGKTTTTGMISVVVNNSSLEPTILLGGELDQIGGNVKIGKTDFLLTEACEYKGNILKFHPTTGIILNIEEDHLDYFKDINHIIATFREFAKLIPKSGNIIVNSDDKYVSEATKDASCNIITFGINNESNYKASNVVYTESGFPSYTLTINNAETYKISLCVMGLHNVYNSLAAIAATHQCGIPVEDILSSISQYTGTHRRLESKGMINGLKVIDDYAHHPTEIKATLNAVKNLKHNKIWCIFQPHTYTRTSALMSYFSESFYDADYVIVADIYAAREKDTGVVHAVDLVNALNTNKVDSVYMPDFTKIAEYILAHGNEGDIVITMGAGDIYQVGEMLLNNF